MMENDRQNELCSKCGQWNELGHVCEPKKNDFEKQFPSLFENCDGVVCRRCGRPSFHEISIQEYCVDKERVKSAIDDVVNHGNEREMKIRKYLFEQLGLVD